MAQLVATNTGRWRVGWSAGTETGAPSDRIVAALTCHPETATWQDGVADGGRRAAMLRSDPACPANWLVFALKPGSGEVRLGAITLEPAR